MIVFKNVKKAYSKPVLKNINFSVSANETVALVGNNGTGKSTIVKIICNITGLDEGQVEILGEKINYNTVKYKNKLGVLLHEPTYIEELTIRDFLSFSLQFRGFKNQPENQKRIVELCEYFQLENIKSTTIEILSNGNKMKVSLIAALIHNPELIVLDEPFVNLDINSLELLKELLLKLKGKRTIFITSHNLDIVTDICDRILILDQGKIIHDLQKRDFEKQEDLIKRIKETTVDESKTSDVSWLFK